ncbi:MAG: ammonium transporter, Amt family [Nocardioidaceae bacterium]|nr:ammonium transporter, Amt family [Nocardioidaceae bacterium]
MHLNTGDTAWVLMSSALVLLMTPGLAFFYGGMVRSKSVLNMLMMSMLTIGIVTPLWVLYGFSLSFGTGSHSSGLIGDLSQLGLSDTLNLGAVNGADYPIPLLVFAAFQLMFAVITPALISGAIADRAKFSAWAVFVGVWVTIVYFPVAHWVFGFGDKNGNGAGWLAHWGVIDFAGGTAVHVDAGAAGLALAIVLGKRIGWRRDPMRPHSLPFVMLGAALLWFGWFGFNAGSALGANGLAAMAFMNTQTATATAMLGWLIVEKYRDGHMTTLGAASGAVTGLVAITPSCSALTPVGSILLGLVAGAVCAYAVGLKYRFGFDDSLDVVGVLLVGGAVGSIAIGFLAAPSSAAGAAGLLYGGGSDGAALLGKQTVAVLAVGTFSFVMAFIIGKVIDLTMGFRISEDDEVTGIDQVEHAETGYELHQGFGGMRTAPVGAVVEDGEKERVDA